MTSTDAVTAASRWARRFLLRPSTFERLVTATRSQSLEFTRVRWRGRRREVITRTAPTDSRSRKLAEPLDPRSFDPWSDDAVTLPERTRQLVQCPACQGAKKLTCPDCHGDAVVGCQSCNGRGTAYSSRSRRIVNCRSCRGQGRRRCGCRDGLVRCPACAGRGKVDRWLEVVEDPFDRVTHSPLDLLARSLPMPVDPVSFDSPASVARLQPEESWTGSPVERIPPEHSGLFDGASPLALRLDARSDRLDELAIEVFCGITTAVDYELLGASGSVHFQHWNGELSETPTSRRPFHRRLALLATTSFMAILAGLVVAVRYAGRHAYLAGNFNSSLLIFLAMALACAALAPASQLALPRRTRRPGRLLVSLLPVLAVAAGQVFAANSGYPSLARARLLAIGGEVDAALREAAATADLGLDARAAAFHDQLLLERALATTDPTAAWEATRAGFYAEDAREAAEEHALDVTLARATELQERGDLITTRSLLMLVPEARAGDDALRALRLAVHRERLDACARTRDTSCVQNELRLARHAGYEDDDLAALYERVAAATSDELRSAWSTIRSRRPLTDRLAACQSFDTPARFLDASGIPTPFHPVDRAAARDVCRQIEEQRVRDEADRRAASQRAWARAPLLCRDGTHSPSCVCGQASRRGCCSWHGGVAGCSAPYPG